MSVKSQVEVAEEALRQALINALAEGEEEYLSELFTQYQAISDLIKKSVTPFVLLIILMSGKGSGENIISIYLLIILIALVEI